MPRCLTRLYRALVPRRPAAVAVPAKGHTVVVTGHLVNHVRLITIHVPGGAKGK